MYFQQINLSNPEKVFIVVKNTYSTAALSNGQGVSWDYVTDQDGVGVTIPPARANNAGMAAAGVVAEAIAVGSYGLVQVYGYHSAVRVRNISGGTPAMTAGAPLALNSAGSVFCLENIDTGSTNILVYPCAFAIGYTTKWTTAAVAAFIKAL